MTQSENIRSLGRKMVGLKRYSEISLNFEIFQNFLVHLDIGGTGMSGTFCTIMWNILYPILINVPLMSGPPYKSEK